MQDDLRHAIEALCWFRFAFDPMRGGMRPEGNGAPVTFTFAQPLTPAQLHSLVIEVFEEDPPRGPLRLWGNPIWLTERQAHIYGLDLDTGQRVYCEWSTRQVTLLLLWGTPATVVEAFYTRLRQLDPVGMLHIGDQPYEELRAQHPAPEDHLTRDTQG